jgi:ABC-type sugar transport system substrate-binding protein
MKLFRSSVVVALALLLVVFVAACQPAAPAPAPTQAPEAAPAPTEAPQAAKPTYKIGYIQTSPDAYYQMQADAAKKVVEYINANEPFNVEMTFVMSESQPEKELANIEDFIAQKYDAIIDFTIAAETAQKGAQEANAAGIPFFVVGSTAADGPGKVTSTIKGDFVKMGGMIGKYIADNYPDAKIAIVEGTLGQGIVEYFEEGFAANLGPNNEIVRKQPGDWNAEKSQNIMSDWLANYNGEFDMVYAMNADIYLGVVRALEDAGKLNNPIKIITGGLAGCAGWEGRGNQLQLADVRIGRPPESGDHCPQRQNGARVGHHPRDDGRQGPPREPAGLGARQGREGLSGVAAALGIGMS